MKIKMPNIFVAYLIAFCLSTISLANGGLEQKTTYYKAFNVYQYNNVGSLVVITHTVEPNVDHVRWGLTADRIDDLRCPTKSITVYLQHGSIPVAQYDGNLTYGNEFTLSRSYLYGPVHIAANESSESIDLLHPPAGTWFLSAFLDDNQSQVIKKITKVDCRYFLLVNVTQSLERAVRDWSADVAIPINITSRPAYLRFYVSATTYAVEILVDCVGSRTDCPVLIRTRRAGLPLDNDEEEEPRSESESRDCSNHSLNNCRLTVVSPDVDQWLYISLRLTTNGTESLPVTVKISTADYALAELNLVEDESPTFQIVNSTEVPSVDSSKTSNISGEVTSSKNSSRNGVSYVALAANDADQSQNSINANEVIVSSDSFLTSSVKRSGSNADPSELDMLEVGLQETQDWLLMENVSAPMIKLEEQTQSALQDDNNSYGGGGTEVGGSESPVGVIGLSRLNDENMPLHTIFSIARDASVTMFMITDNRVTLTRFDINPFRDIGSTLKIRTGLPTLVYQNSESNATKKYNITVHICIQKGRIPVSENGSELLCTNQSDSVSKFISLNKANVDALTLIPFPEPGAWFIAAQRACYEDNIRVKCDRIIALMLQVYTYPCAGKCANGAKCVTYAAGIYEYAACNCIAGYKGFTCADDSAAKSRTVQLIQTLLLTLSNLCFIPAIYISIVRRRPAEAVVYSCNMFFSSFYHACDMSTWSVYVMCIMPYHVLSFCDFLCSLMSFWVTLMAVARVKQWMAHTAHLLAGILLAMAVKWNTHGLVTNLVPIGVGCFVIAASWGIQSYMRKKFIPGKHAVLWLIPGAVFAVVGLCLFAFIENDSNYPYTHSAWHVCMSISIVFLLPTRKSHLSFRDSRRSSILDVVVDQEDVKLVAGSSASSDAMANITAVDIPVDIKEVADQG